MFVFCNPCARAELHKQKHARKLCSATLSVKTEKTDPDAFLSFSTTLETVALKELSHGILATYKINFTLKKT